MDLEIFRDISNIVRDIVTISAIIIGGIWALYKWGYFADRKKKEGISSIDGTLSFKLSELNESQVIVSLEACWRNKGPFSIELSGKNSFLLGKKLDKNNSKNGVLEQGGQYDINSQLFSGIYVLEPKTDSIMSKQIIIPKGDIYFFQWVIGMHEKHSKEFGVEGPAFCSREIIVNPSFELKNT